MCIVQGSRSQNLRSKDRSFRTQSFSTQLRCFRSLAAYRSTQSQDSCQTGFTLIEALVVVLGIGIVAAISAPSFLSWLNARRVERALVEIEAALQETQSEAIKRSKNCRLTIPPPNATGTNAVLTGDCLVSGDRTLQDVLLTHTTNPTTTWDITFDFKGRNTNPPNVGGIIAVSSADGSASIQPRCIQISSGIGLRRAGKYNPLTSQCTP